MEQRGVKRLRESDDLEPPVAEPFSAWESLSNDILATCFSYCDTDDILTLLRCCGVFRQASKLAVSRAECLHLSVLLTRKEYKKCDDRLVSRLLENTGRSLRMLEMSGLRKIRGGEWLRQLLHRCSNLTYVDLGGCAMIQPSTFALSNDESRPSSRGLKHLNLTGCTRIGGETVVHIAYQWRLLETLQAGCSQTIREDQIPLTLACLPVLRTIDFSGLKHMGSQNNWYMFLPASLECLLLGGCERFYFGVLLDSLAGALQELFQLRLAGGSPQEITDLVQVQDMDGIWSIINAVIADPGPGLFDAIRRVHTELDRDTLLKYGLRNLRVLDISSCGSALTEGPRDGIVGLLSCFSGGSLQEVNISGCDNVTDLDIQVLASTCKSLTSLEARACSIGDEALEALGKECEHLSSLDVSACFDITDAGVEALCPIVDGDFHCIDGEVGIVAHEAQGGFIEIKVMMSNPRRGCPALRSLKLASLPNVTGRALQAIGGLCVDRNESWYRSPDAGLENLLLLSTRDCAGVSAAVLGTVMKVARWPSLVEVDARGVDGTVSRNQDHLPNRLRFLNGRRLNVNSPCDRECCTVMHHSQRLNASQGITLQPMYHCIDCELVPSSGRGMCAICASVCHKGHRTFYGSMTRFYCDCAFGIAGGEGCKALKPANERA